MQKHVDIIDIIPDDIFLPALEEVLKIDWNNLPIPDRRSEASVFKTSITNHLRVHKFTKDTPHTIEALSAIVETMDTPARKLYPNIQKLVEWVYARVSGTMLGRIMIVKLSPGGVINAHIDPGEYFMNHYRFHVPFVTDPNVVFFNGNGDELHMPAGHLSQLNNRHMHGAVNRSDVHRIHMIIDIDSDNEEYKIAPI